ncbi:MAG: hypothetical protein JW751_29215 [Polyangiaceae bacterium]|nr:hypothetical protein [Polyangiaceae bacterium]
MIGARVPARGLRARPFLPDLAWATCCVLVAGVVACTPRTLPTPRPSLVGTTGDTGSYPSPASWLYRPSTAGPLNARAVVGEQALLVGDYGERWLVGKQAVAAPIRAPEKLVGLQPGGQGWIFFGESGTSYEARGPLDPFLRAASPTVPLLRVSATQRAIVGLRAGGRMMRSSDTGVSWTEVGPPDAFVIDLMLASDGTGVALSIPERLFFTRDHGKTWEPSDQPSVAAVALHRREDQIFLEGALGWYAVSAARPLALAPSAKLLATPPVKLGRRLARPPDASAIAAGRATVTNGRYLEVVPARGPKGGLALLMGPVAGPLKRRPIEAARDCRSGRLAANGAHLEVVCKRDRQEDAPGALTFLRSFDGGKSWRKEDLAARGSLRALRMAIGPTGELLVTGVCASEGPSRPCKPFGIHRRTKASQKAREGRPPRGRRSEGTKTDEPRAKEQLEAAVTPALRKTALALAFGPGGRAYALGEWTKTGGLAVYVSTDGGRTFAPRDLAGAERSDSGDDEEERDEPAWRRSDEDEADFAVEDFGVGDDGSLAIVLRRWGDLTYSVMDAEGRPLSKAVLPEGADALGASGRRALAYSMAEGRVWETLDGGVSWQPDGTHPTRSCLMALEGGDGVCSVRIACHPGGCLLGDELTRVGWRTDPSVSDPDLLLPPPPRPSRTSQRQRTPIGCVLAADDWRVLEHASSPPEADEAAIGDVAWFALAQDPARGAVGSYHAVGGSKPRVAYVPFFEPPARPRETAQYFTPQVEGAAALRYRMPQPNNPYLTDIEVVWQNHFEGNLRRAKLGRPIAYRPGDFQRGRGVVEQATPDLLSISSGGIYLRIHRSAGSNQPTYFLDGRIVEELPPVTWPSQLRSVTHSEVAHLDTHVPFTVAGPGLSLIRAIREGAGWSFSGIAVGIDDPDSLGVSETAGVGYLGTTMGVEVQVTDLATGRQRGWLYPVSSSTGSVTLPPVSLPTQGDLSDPPRPCEPQDRAKTPRTTAGPVQESRHPVIVSDARDPLRVLHTNQAVLYGTTSTACVAAFDAGGVGSIGSDPERLSAILPMDDLGHAWLFRTASSEENHPAIEYRPMVCRFEPDAELPPEITGSDRGR